MLGGRVCPAAFRSPRRSIIEWPRRRSSTLTSVTSSPPQWRPFSPHCMVQMARLPVGLAGFLPPARGFCHARAVGLHPQHRPLNGGALAAARRACADPRATIHSEGSLCLGSPLSFRRFALKGRAKKAFNKMKSLERKKQREQESKRRKGHSSPSIGGSIKAGGSGLGGSSDANVRPRRGSKRGEGHSQRTSLVLEEVSKYIHHDQALFENVSIGFRDGAKIGILGVNGAGKSSFLKVLAGEDTEIEGKRMCSVDSIGYLRQEPTLDVSLNVKGNVLSGLPENQRDILLEYDAVKRALADCHESGRLSPSDSSLPGLGGGDGGAKSVDQLTKEKCAIESKLTRLGIGSLNARIEQAMSALRCPPGHHSVEHLSGGECRRVALCKLLVSSPDLLLLDEPTNHLDAASVAWLEQYLDSYRGTVLAVTHDRYFLDNVAGWILEFDRGELIPFRGNYSGWLESKAKRLELQDQKAKAAARRMKSELEWINKTPKGRQAKNKARISAFKELQERATQGRKYQSGTVMLPFGKRLGESVIDVSELSFSFKDKKLLDNVYFTIPPGAIVGVVGPNGSGKSTLCKLIMGELSPHQGNIKVGDTVDIGFVSQSRSSLSDDDTVHEAISEGMENVVMADGSLMDIRAYLSAFHFRKEMQSRLVSDLSGGERNRAHLAKQLKNGHNVLIMDEPTNDLDVEVLRSLEDALADFPGSAMIVSHDRWFLDRLCTHILAFEGDGKVYFHRGALGSYVEARRKELGKDWGMLETPFKKIKF